jgi:hypothetical protein
MSSSPGAAASMSLSRTSSRNNRCQRSFERFDVSREKIKNPKENTVFQVYFVFLQAVLFFAMT